MEMFTIREVRTTRVEVVVPAPVNWAELAKVSIAVHQTLLKEGIHASDDAVIVTPGDNEIIFSFEKKPLISPSGSFPLVDAVEVDEDGERL